MFRVRRSGGACTRRKPWLFIYLAVALACTSDKTTPATGCKDNSSCSGGTICQSGACVAPVTSNTPADTTPPPANNPDDTALQQVDTSDQIGPIIEFISPSPFELVGKTLHIEVKITDLSLIKSGSVMAVIADRFVFPLKGAGPYTEDFATAQIQEVLYPTIEVFAADRKGNLSSAGRSFVPDSAPPLLGLTSPDVQTYRYSTDGDQQCSYPFNPLGDTALRSGFVARPGAFALTIRARIQDTGNGVPWDFITNYIGVDPASARLFILDSASSQKLIISNADGQAILNPQVVPGTHPRTPELGETPHPDEALVMTMVPVPVSGAPDLTLTEIKHPSNAATLAADAAAKAANDAAATAITAAAAADATEAVKKAAVDAAKVATDAAEAADAEKTAFLGAEAAATGFDIMTEDWACRLSGGDAPKDAPLSVCGAHPYSSPGITYWLPAAPSVKTPAIYVLDGYNPADPVLCGGGTFGARNIAHDGLVCLVAVAEDKFHNQGVSKPLILCVDRRPIDSTDPDPCPSGFANMNEPELETLALDTCTSGLFPPGFDAVSDMGLQFYGAPTATSP